GSQVSCWLGPPRIQRMMTDRSREDFPGAAASAFSRSASDKPAIPSKPTLRNARRSIARMRRNSGHPFRLGTLRLMIASDSPLDVVTQQWLQGLPQRKTIIKFSQRRSKITLVFLEESVQILGFQVIFPRGRKQFSNEVVEEFRR